MSTVVLTGGSGVVGGAVLRHLLDAGHHVRALSRNREFTERLAGMGVEAIAGNLFDGSVQHASVGADVLYHVAGVNQMCARDPGQMERVNVDGTRLVLLAAERSGVRRVVVTSSAATLGEAQGAIGHESTVHRGWFLSHYERTKTMQEQLAMQWPGPLEVVCVNPSSVQGPGRATGTGELILKALRGELRALPDVPISIVDIDDCAEGHLRAAEHGLPGERYVLNGFTMTTTEAIRLLGVVTGRELRVRSLPARVTRALARGAAGIERLVRLPAPLCAEMLATMAFGHRYDGNRATGDLGLTYRTAADTLRRIVTWAEAEGLV